MKMIETAKEILFKQLDNCLRKIGSYDINSIFPLFYVLVAHHEGCQPSFIAMYEKNTDRRVIQSIITKDSSKSELLDSIKNAVPDSYFQSQSTDYIFSFYEACRPSINEYYQEIIEHIIEYYTLRSGKFSGLSATPTELAHLMAGLVARQNPRKIYDPCAGLCSYALLPELAEIPFTGQEIIQPIKLIAEIRANAANKDITIIHGDSTFEWRGNEGYDCLVSELPFGVRLEDNRHGRSFMLDDFVLNKFIESDSLRKAVLLVSTSTCYRSGYNFDLRKTLCDKNYIDSVIMLPSGILPGTGINCAILILNKERTDKKVKFVLAEDCIQKADKRKLLDAQAVFDRIDGKDDKQSAIIEVGETYNHDCNLTPSVYVINRINVLPGQRLVKFFDLVVKERGIRDYNDQKGRLLKPEHMADSVASLHSKEVNIDIDDVTSKPYFKVCGKCVIFNVRADKFYIKNDEEALFISPNYSCFRVDETRCIPEYLADCVANAEYFRNSALVGAAMPRLRYEDLYLPVYESLETQHQIIQRIFRQEKNELKKKLDRLQVLSGESSDLIHNLGITFTKISAGLSNLKSLGDNETIESMDDNVQFALRQINCTGTDFEHVVPEFEKVNVYEILDSYIKAWGNFGYTTFDILPIQREMANDTKIEIDRTLFYTLLDCIFINAHQHGFAKRYSEDNKLVITVEGVTYKDDDYVRIGISNNGKPLPENFTVKDFAQRGIVGINSSQDGIGGDHVCKIAHHHSGYISIDSESEWLTFNVLIPIYTTSSKNFNEYEYESI
jgi:type I restriction-modification system DNA methylase subunit